MSNLLFGSLNLDNARWGITRDISEVREYGGFGWFLLVACFALPLASILTLIFRRWLALVPLAISGGLFAVWVLYYATSWFANPGQGGWAFPFALVILGWLVLLKAVTGWPKRYDSRS